MKLLNRGYRVSGISIRPAESLSPARNQVRLEWMGTAFRYRYELPAEAEWAAATKLEESAAQELPRQATEAIAALEESAAQPAQYSVER